MSPDLPAARDSNGVLSQQAAAEMPPPGPTSFHHFVDHVRSLDGIVYGTRMYEVMRYWDKDQPDWDENEHAFRPAPGAPGPSGSPPIPLSPSAPTPP